jgi:hypothetical protein
MKNPDVLEFCAAFICNPEEGDNIHFQNVGNIANNITVEQPKNRIYTDNLRP